tara:strand:- start:1577 stop:1882 length:306 start_codon:yes stop_codon:yes gene_type:complete
MKQKLLICIMVLSMMLVGCSTNIHTVGAGPQTGMSNTARQYYLLYGLIPVNRVDTNEMAKSMQAENYEIKTQVGPVDVGINLASAILVGGVVSSRTVTVTK